MKSLLQLSNVIGATITEVPVNPCQRMNCWDAGCSRYMYVGPDPLLLTTNLTSLVAANGKLGCR